MITASATSGPQKVASLLLTLDRATAAELLRRLPEDDRKAVTKALAAMSNVFLGKDVQESLLREFRSTLDVSEGAAAGAEHICSLLSDALGEEAGSYAGELEIQGRKAHAKSLLADLDQRSLGFVLQGEHPQAIAVILMELGPEAAAGVMPRFEELMQQELVERMVTMKAPPDDLVIELLEAAARKAADLERVTAPQIDPEVKLKTVATILGKFQDEAQQNLLMNLEINDPELAEKVRQQLFTFEDMLKLGSREVQRVLSGVDTKVLATALKGANKEQSEFLLGNVSKRTVERVREERETLGAVKLSEVKKAQMDMASVARDLIQRGEIQFGGGSDELVS